MACTHPQAMANKEAAHLHRVAPLETMHLALMVICMLGFILGVTGNGFTIFINACRKKKTVKDIWHLNMAISGFIFAIFLPLTMTQLVMGLHWYLTRTLCNITNLATSLNMFSSSFHHTAISADLCISTVYPAWAKNYRTVHLASLVTLGIWILTVMASWRYHGICSDQSLLLRESGEVASVATRFLVGFLVPLVLISICLVTLFAKLSWNKMAWSKKPFQTFPMLHIIFFLCWFPYHVITFLQTLPKVSAPEITESLEIRTIFAHALLCFNSCFYPLFYLIKQHRFVNCQRQKQNCQTPGNVGLELVEIGGNG